MIGDAATWIVVTAAAVALLAAVTLAVAGGALGWGGMLLRPDPSVGEFVAAVVLLAVLVPAHVRIVLGRFGPRAAAEPAPAQTKDLSAGP
jgi:fatty acid desaturase